MPDAQQPIADPRAQRAPSVASFGARLSALYGQSGVRRGIVLAALAAAVGLQYYLVNVPISDLGQSNKFSPATVKAADQVVYFKNPESDPGSFTFSFDQPAQSPQERMVVDAYFDDAALSGESVQKLAAFGVHPPTGSAAISYLTFAKPDGSCNTAFQVATTGVPLQTRVAEFSQSEPAPSNRHRLLDLKFTGLDAAVTLSSQGTFGADGKSACEITLRVGQWEQKMGGFVPVTVKVPSGSGYRFQWEAVEVQPYLAFGHAHRQSFHADEVAIRPEQAPEQGASREGLVAERERKDAPLTVDSLLIGTDHLQFGASGKGHTRENGRLLATANLIETINKYPLIAALFGAANLALLNWAKRSFFPPPRATVVAFPKEERVDEEPESPGKVG